MSKRNLNLDRKEFADLIKLVFVLGALMYLVLFNVARPRVLILHSYGLEYSWTRNVDVGLSRILDKRKNISVYRQYMDTKRHPELSFKQKSGLLARRMIQRLRPQLIIAVDDDAQEYVGKYYIDHPHTDIVFCGVNAPLKEYGYDRAQNVTGIIQKIPLEVFRETIPLLLGEEGKHKKEIRVISLGDVSPSVKFDEAHIRAFDWKPLYLIDSILVTTFEEWKKQVKEIQNRADCLMVLNYRQLRRSQTDRTLVPPKEIMTWTQENSKIPLLGMTGAMVVDGGQISIQTSPYEQGEIAAKMALRIVSGKKPKDIPVQVAKNFLIYLRKDLNSVVTR